MSLIELHYKEVENLTKEMFQNGRIEIGSTTILLEPLEEWSVCFGEDINVLVKEAIEKAMDEELESDFKNWDYL